MIHIGLDWAENRYNTGHRKLRSMKSVLSSGRKQKKCCLPSSTEFMGMLHTEQNINIKVNFRYKRASTKEWQVLNEGWHCILGPQIRREWKWKGRLEAKGRNTCRRPTSRDSVEQRAQMISPGRDWCTFNWPHLGTENVVKDWTGSVRGKL